MSALSYFAPRALPPGLAAKARSLTCLSLLCFALADVRDGLGPFLGIFLQSHGWTPDSIGYVMTIGGLAGMAVTTPLGALADATSIRCWWAAPRSSRPSARRPWPRPSAA